MKRQLFSLLLLLFATVVLLIMSTSTALAHGHVEVGEYELVIGFHNEPAYAGEPNGLDLFVTHLTTEESVNGLEETLRAEIIFGSSRREVQLRPQFGQEGAYTADVLPTAAGDYTWHIWGAIEGTPVDVTMTSSPDTFSSIEPKSSVAFPAPEPTTAELQEGLAAAGRTAQIALLIGGVGALLGLTGLVVGYRGMKAARRAAA
jgi:hypothetical protein